MNSANRVFLNDKGIVEIHVVGDQTPSSVQAMADEAMQLCAQQRSKHKPALVLDNLLQIGTVPAEARRLVAQLVRSTDYDRFAMLGSGAVLKLGANLILRATGRGAYVSYFDDEQKAIAWLQA